MCEANDFNYLSKWFSTTNQLDDQISSEFKKQRKTLLTNAWLMWEIFWQDTGSKRIPTP